MDAEMIDSRSPAAHHLTDEEMEASTAEMQPVAVELDMQEASQQEIEAKEANDLIDADEDGILPISSASALSSTAPLVEANTSSAMSLVSSPVPTPVSSISAPHSPIPVASTSSYVFDCVPATSAPSPAITEIAPTEEKVKSLAENSTPFSQNEVDQLAAIVEAKDEASVEENLSVVPSVAQSRATSPAPVEAQEIPDASFSHEDDMITATILEDEYNNDYYIMPDLADRPPAQKELLEHIQFPPSLSKYLSKPAEEQDELEDETPKDVNEDDVVRRAPPVLLTFRNESFWLFGTFNETEVDVPSTAPLFEDAAEHHLYYNPLAMLFNRLHDHFPSFEASQMEMILSVEKLDMTLTEDNAYSNEISLHDFGRIHIGCDQPAPMQLSLHESPRFIHRFNALANHVAKFTADDMQNLSDDGNDTQVDATEAAVEDDGEVATAETLETAEVLDDQPDAIENEDFANDEAPEEGGEAFDADAGANEETTLVDENENAEEDQLEHSPVEHAEEDDEIREEVAAPIDLTGEDEVNDVASEEYSETPATSNHVATEEQEVDELAEAHDSVVDDDAVKSEDQAVSSNGVSDHSDATITVQVSPSVHVNGKASKDQTFSPKRTRDEVSDVPDSKHDITQPEAKRVKAQ